ncbi:MAG: hypothetical protein QOG23_2204 [Blastocatellia bacterium]|nr:hypothetical protein [Blastocatellia bacterium]
MMMMLAFGFGITFLPHDLYGDDICGDAESVLSFYLRPPNWIAQPSSIDRLGAVSYTRWSVERASVVTRNGENIPTRMPVFAFLSRFEIPIYNPHPY